MDELEAALEELAGGESEEENDLEEKKEETPGKKRDWPQTYERRLDNDQRRWNRMSIALKHNMGIGHTLSLAESFVNISWL